MCTECRQSPCHPSCPNEDAPPVYCCEICGEGIYSGEFWWDINDMVLCEDCVGDTKRRA